MVHLVTLDISLWQAGARCLPHQLPNRHGHHGEYTQLFSETSRDDALYEYLSSESYPPVKMLSSSFCDSVYNQEESVNMNQSSIDRGLSRSIYYRSYMDLEKKNGVQQWEKFEKPSRENTLRMKHGTYAKLEDEGLIASGTSVRGATTAIGEMAPIPQDSEELGQRARTHLRRDVSTPLKSTESGIVDQVLITTDSEGQKFVKV
ncbi:DNA-dependent RNA polymerase II [Marasmius sp. AFHP31]|nr:DNA-dependent RNA polymerase II [Marasmius sp. AFHP31]